MAVQIRFSGGENNLDPNGSLGGQRSDTSMTDDTVENIFDNINRAEALIGRTEFRCIYIYNTGGAHVSGMTLQVTVNPAVTQISLGLDPAGSGDGRTSGVAVSITQEDIAPAGVKFFGEANPDDGNFNVAYDHVTLPIGLLKSGEGQAVWLKRKTETGAAQTVSVTSIILHEAVTLPGDTIDDGGAVGEAILADVQVSGTYVIGTMRVDFSDLG